MAETHAFGDREAMFKDLTATTDLYKALVDVRFRLLVFVPTITTLTVGILKFNLRTTDETTPTVIVAIAVLGLIVTIAIVIYEIRNSQIHDRAIHRIKHLERVLGFEPSYRGSPGGVFNERGSGDRLFRVIGVKHDRALELIYGSVVAAWTWMLLAGAAGARDWHKRPSRLTYAAEHIPLELLIDHKWTGWARVVVAVAAGLAVAEAIGRHGGRGREPGLVYTLAKAATTVAAVRAVTAAKVAAEAAEKAATATAKLAGSGNVQSAYMREADDAAKATAEAAKTAKKAAMTTAEAAEVAEVAEAAAKAADAAKAAAEATKAAAEATKAAKKAATASTNLAQKAREKTVDAKTKVVEAKTKVVDACDTAKTHLGELIKVELESIRREAEDPKPFWKRKTLWERWRPCAWGARGSIFQLMGGKARSREALVELARATGLIKDEQKWWSFWWYGVRATTAKNARNKRLKAIPGDATTLNSDAVRKGIVGAPEVAEAMCEFRAGYRIRAARQRIELRYGTGSPWATDEEITLRIELLEAVGWPKP